jgi:hypothetical protein
MPDKPFSRRRFQFRLRTLLLVVTLVAVASWVVADRQRLIRERDEAAQERRDALRELRASRALMDQTLDQAEKSRADAMLYRRQVDDLNATLANKK